MSSAKGYDAFENEYEGGLGGGEEVMDQVRAVLEARASLHVSGGSVVSFPTGHSAERVVAELEGAGTAAPLKLLESVDEQASAPAPHPCPPLDFGKQSTPRPMPV